MRRPARAETVKAAAARARAPRPAEQFNGREAVLRAAAQVFHERGYSASTMDDVAQVMDATKGRVYHYYRSKMELFLEVQELALRTILEPVRAVYESDLPPEAKFHAMCVQQVKVMMGEFALTRVGVQGLERHLMNEASAQQYRMMRKFLKMRDEYERMFATVIEEGVRKGVFKPGPVGLRTKAALGVLNWTTIWFNPDRASSDEERNSIANALAQFATDGLSQPSPGHG